MSKVTCAACGKTWDLKGPLDARILSVHRASHDDDDYPASERGEREILRFAPFDLTHNREVDE